MLTRREFSTVFGMAAAAGSLGSAGVLQGQGGAVGEPGRSARLSVMLWALTGVAKPFMERLELAARAGYRCVELVDEFRTWSEAEWVAVLERMHALGLTVDAIAPLKLGFADPAGGAAMLAELESVLPALRRLGAPQIILVSGPRGKTAAAGEESMAAQHAVAVETLRAVAAVLERERMVAVIEPIDRLENPPVYLDTVTEAFALTRAVGSAQVKVLYDFFHEQRTHGNLIEKLEGGDLGGGSGACGGCAREAPAGDGRGELRQRVRRAAARWGTGAGWRWSSIRRGMRWRCCGRRGWRRRPGWVGERGWRVGGPRCCDW